MNRWVYISLILLWSGMVSVQGRVFRSGGTADGRLNTVGLPWEAAYQTTMDVNGQQNELHIFSAHRHEPVVDQLTDQFERQGARVRIAETSDGARGIAQWEDREARILVLSPAGQPNRMVFLFYPVSGQTGAPAKLPVPEYPGGRSRQTVQNEDTGTISQTTETEDLPQQVHAYYAGALSADGWRTVIPPGTGSSRMAIYQKRKRICCVLASQQPEGPNRVTLLVKGGGL